MQEIEQLKTELRTRDSSLKMLGVCLYALSLKSSRFLHCCVPSMQLPHGPLLNSMTANLPNVDAPLLGVSGLLH